MAQAIIGAEWLFLHKGPGATNHFEGGGFARSNDDVDYPNLMFHFLPIAVRYDGTAPEGGHGYQVHIGPMYSDARGRVRITSADPEQPPSILFNYLSTDQDRREWVEAIRVAREHPRAACIRAYSDGEISPGPQVESDEEILEWVRKDGETAYHPSCTCRMGTDDMSVVDPADHEGPWHAGPARGRCLRHALHHQRESVCADHDDRREGGRSHHWRQSPPAGGRSVLSSP